MPKYFLLVLTMLSDLLIPAACALVLYLLPWNPIVLLLVLAVYTQWNDTGGFMVWKRKERRIYLENAKKYGL